MDSVLILCFVTRHPDAIADSNTGNSSAALSVDEVSVFRLGEIKETSRRIDQPAGMSAWAEGVTRVST